MFWFECIPRGWNFYFFPFPFFHRYLSRFPALLASWPSPPPFAVPDLALSLRIRVRKRRVSRGLEDDGKACEIDGTY